MQTLPPGAGVVRSVPPLAQRVEALPWEQLEHDLWSFGAAKTPPLLTPRECEDLRSL